jgi:tRNA-dihydrouridine synthase B
MYKNSLQIGTIILPHRLIQGPLAGYSCVPLRELFYQFIPPAYSVSEMISAQDILLKHSDKSRFLYRSPRENRLAYQISGIDKNIMAEAAYRLQEHGANLIDINCGCPKEKIRKKGAGSALLESPDRLIQIITSVHQRITIPLTIKMRIQGNEQDISLAQRIEAAGADALIVHGRRWQDSYDVHCNYEQIGLIKRNISIPVIANGDLFNLSDLETAMKQTGCDGLMIARAGCGHPWIYQEFLENQDLGISLQQINDIFMSHLERLSALEGEYKAIQQSKSLGRYYFKQYWNAQQFQHFYQLDSLKRIAIFLLLNRFGLGSD